MGSPQSDNKDGDISSDDAFTAQTKIEPPDEHNPGSIYTNLQKSLPDNPMLMAGNQNRLSNDHVSNMYQDFQTL